MEQRIGREKLFHDDLANKDQRVRTAGRFYAIDIAAREYYESQLSKFDSTLGVLEYGCGGQTTRELSHLGYSVTAIDISINSILKARQDNESVQAISPEFAVMNAESLGFRSRSFGGVCGTGILHHLNIVRACEEIKRVLVPGGMAVFLEPLGHNPLINLYRRMTPSLRTTDEHPLFQSDIDAIRQYFPRVECQFFYLTALLAVPFRKMAGFNSLTRILNCIDAQLFRLFPWLRKQAWIVVMTITN